MLKSVPRKVNISSDNGKLSQEPSKPSPSQNIIVKVKIYFKEAFQQHFLLYQESVGVSLISLREIVVPASNIVCKKSIYKINVSLFIGFIMLDVPFFVLAL